MNYLKKQSKKSSNKAFITKCSRVKAAALLFVFATLFITNTAVCFAADDEPILKFASMSDLHLDEKVMQSESLFHSNQSQFDNALSVAVSKGYDDLFICGGDMSSYGDTSYWYQIKEKVANAGFEKALYTLGNHEYGTLRENPDADDDFLAFTGLESYSYVEKVSGMNFIFLGAEDYDLGDYLSDEQVLWFAGALEAAVNDTPDKPIFVISHYPELYKKIGDRLTGSLSSYENVFFLYGHVHDERWEDYDITGYMSLEKGHVSTRMGSVQYGFTNAADVLLVDVYDNRVSLTIERTDGSVLDIKTTTVYLAKSSSECMVERIAVYNGKSTVDLNYTLPCDGLICISSYDDSGRFCGCEYHPLSAAEHSKSIELVNQVYSVGAIKAVFCDNYFNPISGVSQLQW